MPWAVDKHAELPLAHLEIVGISRQEPVRVGWPHASTVDLFAAP